MKSPWLVISWLGGISGARSSRSKLCFNCLRIDLSWSSQPPCLLLFSAHPSNIDFGELQATLGGKIVALQEQPIKVNLHFNSYSYHEFQVHPFQPKVLLRKGILIRWIVIVIWTNGNGRFVRASVEVTNYGGYVARKSFVLHKSRLCMCEICLCLMRTEVTSGG